MISAEVQSFPEIVSHSESHTQETAGSTCKFPAPPAEALLCVQVCACMCVRVCVQVYMCEQLCVCMYAIMSVHVCVCVMTGFTSCGGTAVCMSVCVNVYV